MQENQDYFQMRMESILEDLEGELEADDSQEDLSALQEPNIEQLEDDLYRADERHQELVNIQEMLVESGGVSRSMAENFKDLLPAEMALESFTGQVTKTNHKMSLEFIGTAIGLVAAAGVVAVLGTVGYLVYRIVKFKKRLPNTKLDKQVTAMFNTVEDKLKTAISELRDLFPEASHQDLAWRRNDGLVQAALVNNCQEIDIEMLTGQYKALSGSAGSDTMRQALAIEKFFKEGIFPELDKMIKAGTGKDIENVTKKLQEYKLEDLVSAHLERFGHDKHLKFDKPSAVCAAFRTKYTGGVPANEITTRLANVKAAPASMSEDVIQTMFKAQTIMVSLADRIQGYEKRLDKSKELPGDYVSEVRGLLQKCKEPLNSLADVFTIVEIEVASHKRSSKIKAGAVANGFKAVSEFYQEQAKTDKENSKAYKACVNHLKKVFDPIASALR